MLLLAFQDAPMGYPAESGAGGMDLTSLLILLAFFLIALGLVAALIFAMLVSHRSRVMKHEERMAMIKAGIHPDYPPGEVPEHKPNGARETVDHKPVRQTHGAAQPPKLGKA